MNWKKLFERPIEKNHFQGQAQTDTKNFWLCLKIKHATCLKAIIQYDKAV